MRSPGPHCGPWTVRAVGNAVTGINSLSRRPGPHCSPEPRAPHTGPLPRTFWVASGSDSCRFESTQNDAAPNRSPGPHTFWVASGSGSCSLARFSGRHGRGIFSRANPEDSAAVTTSDELATDGAAGDGGSLSPELAEIYGAQRAWEWRGHKVNYSVLGSSRGKGEESSAVVLVHGFGASIGHWRKTMPLLARDGLCRVYALDLLGLGASDKPAGFPYSIEAWAEMVDDFAGQVVEERQLVFVGNSIGSLITLAAAAAAASDGAGLAGRVKGIVLLNCTGGLNNKAIQDDWRIALALPIFSLIDFLLSIPSVARAIFNAVRTRENVKAALLSVYCNRDSVDEELIDVILRPADDEGALGVFVAVITGPPGPRPETLVPRLTCPILLLWGDKDTFTPFDGPIGKFFRALPSVRPDTAFVELQNVGHCPQDDRAELVHDSLLPWLETLFSRK